MEQSSFWQTNSNLADQEITCLLMKPKDSLLCLIEPAAGPCLEPYESNLPYHHVYITSSCHLSPRFSAQHFLHVSWCFHPSCKCPAQFILIGSRSLIIFSGQYRLCSSLFCSFLHFPVTSAFLDPDILLSALSSNAFDLFSSHSVRDQVQYPCNMILVQYICSFTTHLEVVSAFRNLRALRTVVTDQMLNMDRLTSLPFHGILIGFRKFGELHVSVSISANKSN